MTNRIFRVFRVFRGYSPWLACALLVAACLVMSGCEHAPGPADYAQATAISQAAAVKATAAAQAMQIEATAAAQKAAERQATAGARSFTVGLLWLALGLFVLALAVGSALAVVGWLNKRATTVYPNSAGQYPVMISRGFGWVTYHDPSRGLGPGAVYQTPTLLDVLAGVLARLRGRPASPPALTADYPANGSEAAMAQVAGQAQAIGLMAAATRPAGWLDRPQPQRPAARELAQNALTEAGLSGGRMPAVRQVTDPDKNARLVELLNN